MELVTLTNMCMVCDGDRVVVQERTGSWPGVAFPGGHVEKGEPLTDAIIREIREETGLTIIRPRLCGVKNWRDSWNEDRYIVLLYRADRFTGTLKSSSEGRVWWERMDNLRNLPLCDGMEDTLRLYAAPDEIGEIFNYRETRESDWITEFK